MRDEAWEEAGLRGTWVEDSSDGLAWGGTACLYAAAALKAASLLGVSNIGAVPLSQAPGQFAAEACAFKVAAAKAATVAKAKTIAGVRAASAEVAGKAQQAYIWGMEKWVGLNNWLTGGGTASSRASQGRNILRPQKFRGSLGAQGSAGVTRQSVVRGLMGHTAQGDEIAAGIECGNIRLNVLGGELFEKAYRLRGGTETIAPRAFQWANSIYVRRGSSHLLSDVVHEGTHAMDVIFRLVKVPYDTNPYIWEQRAHDAAREFEMAIRGVVEFPKIEEMMRHIFRRY